VPPAPRPGLPQAAIGLGSNLGDRRATLVAALQVLQDLQGIRLLARSCWYRTAPVGPAQPDYLNACALLEVSLTAEALLQCLLETEARFGRVRRERWGPRHLDLDLLLYNRQTLDTPQLQRPHPRLRERAFVLLPLAEIAAQWIDPVTGLSIAVLADRVPDQHTVQRLEEAAGLPPGW
jgi:2-amino-4-hydroxy-6-hydroxymethyldihydropteridine diphosphokinase